MPTCRAERQEEPPNGSSEVVWPCPQIELRSNRNQVHALLVGFKEAPQCTRVQALPPPASTSCSNHNSATLRRGHLLAAPALELLAAARRQVRACALLAWLPVAGEALVVRGATTLNTCACAGGGAGTHIRCLAHQPKPATNTHQQVYKHTRPAGASLLV